MTAVAILGVFVADLSFEAPRLPVMGETLLGSGFVMGPGGKGSNQAVAAAKAGAHTSFLTRLGNDAFGKIALDTWERAGVSTDAVIRMDDAPTGAAFIFVSTETRDNAIIVESGAAGHLAPADIDTLSHTIEGAKVFVTQLEQPMDAAEHGLARARAARVTTILNPAPAAPLSQEVLALCDVITPNESEAAALTGISVDSVDDARAAATALRNAGVGSALITLGERGALYDDGATCELVPAFSAGAVCDTTGAGDAFNGAFAAALAEGRPSLDAVRFACAAASLSVTRRGAAAAMASRAEIDALLARA